MAEKVNRSPLKAIRRHCIECCGGLAQEVRLCPLKSCPLYGFRFGHRLPRDTTPGDDQPEKTQDSAL